MKKTRELYFTYGNDDRVKEPTINSIKKRIIKSMEQEYYKEWKIISEDEVEFTREGRNLCKLTIGIEYEEYSKEELIDKIRKDIRLTFAKVFEHKEKVSCLLGTKLYKEKFTDEYRELIDKEEELLKELIGVLDDRVNIGIK